MPRGFQRVRPSAAPFDRQNLYDATNLSLTSYDPQNSTLAAAGIAALWCPSDYGISTPQQDWSAGGQVWGTSYSAVTGPWEWDQFFLVPGSLDRPLPGEAQRIAQLGLIYPLSSVPLAAVTDGLSNTLLFAETDFTTWYTWWIAGDGWDTLAATMAPPNIAMPVLPGWQPLNIDSLHPGGVNCAFGDGSVKFIKNSIDSWPFDTDSGWSPSLGWNLQGQPPYYLFETPHILPGAKVGIWRARIERRSGGEIIAADSY